MPKCQIYVQADFNRQKQGAMSATAEEKRGTHRLRTMLDWYRRSDCDRWAVSGLASPDLPREQEPA